MPTSAPILLLISRKQILLAICGQIWLLVQSFGKGFFWGAIYLVVHFHIQEISLIVSRYPPRGCRTKWVCGCLIPIISLAMFLLPAVPIEVIPLLAGVVSAYLTRTRRQCNSSIAGTECIPLFLEAINRLFLVVTVRSGRYFVHLLEWLFTADLKPTVLPQALKLTLDWG